jgi:hypothetical protein
MAGTSPRRKEGTMSFIDTPGIIRETCDGICTVAIQDEMLQERKISLFGLADEVTKSI